MVCHKKHGHIHFSPKTCSALCTCSRGESRTKHEIEKPSTFVAGVHKGKGGLEEEEVETRGGRGRWWCVCVGRGGRGIGRERGEERGGWEGGRGGWGVWCVIRSSSQELNRHYSARQVLRHIQFSRARETPISTTAADQHVQLHKNWINHNISAPSVQRHNSSFGYLRNKSSAQQLLRNFQQD